MSHLCGLLLSVYAVKHALCYVFGHGVNTNRHLA